MSRTPGRMPMAMAAAAPAMKPSTTTGMRRDAPAEHEPAHGREFRSADLGEYVDGIIRIGAVDCNAAPDEAGLVADALGRDAGADARHLVNRRAGEHGGDGRGGRSVADAHFPGGKQGHASGRLLAGHVGAYLHTGQCFFTGHGRAFAEVAGRVHDLAAHQAPPHRRGRSSRPRPRRKAALRHCGRRRLSCRRP